MSAGSFTRNLHVLEKRTQARFYSPRLNRFVQADTIVPRHRNPQNFNRYTYTANSPLNYIDPTGHSLICLDTFGCENTSQEDIIDTGPPVLGTPPPASGGGGNDSADDDLGTEDCITNPEIASTQECRDELAGSTPSGSQLSLCEAKPWHTGCENILTYTRCYALVANTQYYDGWHEVDCSLKANYPEYRVNFGGDFWWYTGGLLIDAAGFLISGAVLVTSAEPAVSVPLAGVDAVYSLVELSWVLIAENLWEPQDLGRYYLIREEDRRSITPVGGIFASAEGFFSNLAGIVSTYEKIPAWIEYPSYAPPNP